MSNCLFAYNQALFPASTGGALFLSDVAFTLQNVVFVNNRAQSAGGALRVVNAATITLVGVDFAQNFASAGGTQLHSVSVGDIAIGGVRMLLSRNLTSFEIPAGGQLILLPQNVSTPISPNANASSPTLGSVILLQSPDGYQLQVSVR